MSVGETSIDRCDRDALLPLGASLGGGKMMMSPTLHVLPVQIFVGPPG